MLWEIVYKIHFLVFSAPCAYSNIYIGIFCWRKLKIIKDKFCSLLKYFTETNAVTWTVNISNIGLIFIPNSSLKSHYQSTFFHLILFMCTKRPCIIYFTWSYFCLPPLLYAAVAARLTEVGLSEFPFQHGSEIHRLLTLTHQDRAWEDKRHLQRWVTRSKWRLKVSL